MNQNEMIIFCYKDFYHKKLGKIFEKNKKYKCWIEKSTIYNDDNDDIWVEYDPFGNIGNQGCRFYIKNKRGNLLKFNEYFKTPNELRKEKIKKLNENW